MSLDLRVIDLGIKKGSFNNSLDFAIMDSVASGKSPSTLLFTEWLPTISLGKSQSCELDVDKDACIRESVEIVRRDTGGKAVYLDEGYLVVSFFAKPYLLPKELFSIRKLLCEKMTKSLEKYDIPVKLYEPVDIFIEEGGSFRTIGNSGQRIKEDVILLQGSIRLKLLNLNKMLNVLKVNGLKLNPYEDEVKRVLANVHEYNRRITKYDLKDQLISIFCEEQRFKEVRESLNEFELERIEKYLSVHDKNSKITDSPEYKSRGVCYFYLNNQNLLPFLEKSAKAINGELFHG